MLQYCQLQIDLSEIIEIEIDGKVKLRIKATIDAKDLLHNADTAISVPRVWYSLPPIELPTIASAKVAELGSIPAPFFRPRT